MKFLSVEGAVAAAAKFGDVKVLVVGDVMLDVYDFCFERDSKVIDYEMPGKRAYRAHESIRVLGGAGNVAANLAALGVSTHLVGVTGDDGHHFTLGKIADSHAIAHHLLRDHSRPTTVKTRIYVDDDYVLRRDDEETHEVAGDLAAAAVAEARNLVARVDAVILSDYDKGMFTAEVAQQIIECAAARGIPVVVDFKPPNAALFRGATTIAPNEREADALQPGFRGCADLEEPTRRLHGALGCRNTVVTLGARGLCGFDGATFFHVPARKVEVVSPVGCGDTVRAVLALGAALGLSLPEAAELANAAAATIIQKKATATITAREVIAFLREC